MKYREPKMFVVELYYKNPAQYPDVSTEFITDVSVRDALYLTTKVIENAQVFCLEEASHICASFNKMFPEFFVITLHQTYKVPLDYGKSNYTLESHISE